MSSAQQQHSAVTTKKDATRKKKKASSSSSSIKDLSDSSQDDDSFSDHDAISSHGANTADAQSNVSSSDYSTSGSDWAEECPEEVSSDEVDISLVIPRGRRQAAINSGFAR